VDRQRGWGTGLGWQVLAVPVILLPYLALLYGLSLLFAAFGVYLRDLSQIVGVLVMVVLFTGAVFFPGPWYPRSFLA